jgi:NAD-dependent DNA ligase
VSIGGATISRASLCNLRVINEDLNGLKINDEVYVVRRGEVIPKVIGKVK